MRSFVLLTFLLLSYWSAFAQTVRIDSIKKALNAHPEPDTLRVEMLLALGNTYRHKNIDSARMYGTEALEVSEQKQFLTGIGSASSLLGKLYYYQGEYEKAIAYHTKAMEIAEKTKASMRLAVSHLDMGGAQTMANQQTEAIETFKNGIEHAQKTKHYGLIGEFHLRIANLYVFLADYEQGIEFLEQALAFKQKGNEHRGIADVYYRFGLIYSLLGNYPIALEYLQKALVNVEKKGGMRSQKVRINRAVGNVYVSLNDYSKAIEYFQVAYQLLRTTNSTSLIITTYQSIGSAYEQTQLPDSAKRYYEKALELAQKTNSKSEIATSLFGLGAIAIEEGKPQKAIKFLQEANALRTALDERIAFAETNILQGKAYLANGNPQLAEQALLEGIKQAEALNSYPDLNQGYATLYQLYQTEGQYKKALEAHINYKATSDSLLNESNIREITTLENQYEFDREKEQLAIEQARKEALAQAELSQEKLIRNVSLGGLAFVAILAFVLYRNFDQKRRSNVLLSEQKGQIEAKNSENELLLKEIHHRVKNNLQIVSSLLNLQTKATEDEAALAAMSEGQNRVKAMALIHQGLYQNEDLASIDFGEYAQSLADQLTSIYKDDRETQLQVEAVGQKFDIDTAVPLGLILNELLTNSFKYAFETLDSKQLTIRLSEIEKGKHRLEVFDNGKGLPEGIDWAKAKSTGLRLVRRLTKQLQGEFNYVFESGAHFIIDFKNTELRKQTL